METNTLHRAAIVFNGKFTIINPEGDHRTFRIRTNKKGSNFAPGKRIVSLLTGPDNQSSYTSFGFVTDDGIQVWRSKQGGIFDKYAPMLWNMLTKGKESFFAKRGYQIKESLTCLVCNRELTEPESLVSGVGPICAGRVSLFSR